MRGDAAHILLVAGHLHVPAFAPRLAPRVLDQPIVHAAPPVGSISDNQDCMVKGLRVACLLSIDTLVVELERAVRRVNGNGNRSNGCNGSLQGILVSFPDIDEAFIGSSNMAGTMGK